jgi:hypothetical protein
VRRGRGAQAATFSITRASNVCDEAMRAAAAVAQFNLSEEQRKAARLATEVSDPFADVTAALRQGLCEPGFGRSPPCR